MSYSCADFVEDVSGLFPNQQPDGGEDWEGDVLAELFENIAEEVARLRRVETGPGLPTMATKPQK